MKLYDTKGSASVTVEFEPADVERWYHVRIVCSV